MHDEHKEFMEHLSIILEALSFFLVTIDLYGDRFNELREKVTKKSSLQQVLSIRRYQLKSSKVLGWLFVPLFVAIFIPMLAGIQFLMEYFNPTSKYEVWYTTLILTLGIVGFIVSGIILNFMGAFIIKSFFYISLLILKIVQYMTKLFPIDGMMLTFGAILFVISKVIAYQNV